MTEVATVSVQISSKEAKAGKRAVLAELSQLRRAVKRLNRDVDNLNKSFGGMGKRFKSAAGGLNTVTKAAVRQSRAFGGVRKSARQSTGALGQFNLKMRELTKSVQIALGPLSGVAARITAFTSLVGSANIKLAALIASIIAFTFAVFKAIKAAANFETILADIRKTSGITGAALTSMGDDILRASAKLGISAAEIGKIAVVAGQLGIKGSANIVKFSTEIAKLSRTSDFAAETGAKALAGILNITGESVTEIGKLSAVITRLAATTKASEAEIVEISQEIARGTVAFRLGSTEILAIGAALKSLEVRSEAAGTAVFKAFFKIQEAIEGGGRKLKLLSELTGVAVKDLDKAFRQDPGRIFSAFLKGIGEVSSEVGASTKILREFELVDARVLKTVGVLAERFPVLAAAQSEARDEAKKLSATNLELAAVSETLNFKLSNLGSNIQNILIKSGQRALPTVSALADELVDLTRDFEAAARAIDILILSVLGFISGKVLGALIGRLLKLGTVLVAVRAAFLSIAAGAAAAGFASLANPIGAVLALLGLVIGGLIAFSRNAKAAQDPAEALANINEDLADSLKNVSAGTKDATRDILQFAQVRITGEIFRLEEQTRALATRLAARRAIVRGAGAGLGAQAVRGAEASQIRADIEALNDLEGFLFRAKRSFAELTEEMSALTDETDEVRKLATTFSELSDAGKKSSRSIEGLIADFADLKVAVELAAGAKTIEALFKIEDLLDAKKILRGIAKTDIPLIAEGLGLAADATEDQLLAAVLRLKTGVRGLEDDFDAIKDPLEDMDKFLDKISKKLEKTPGIRAKALKTLERQVAEVQRETVLLEMEEKVADRLRIIDKARLDLIKARGAEGVKLLEQLDAELRLRQEAEDRKEGREAIKDLQELISETERETVLLHMNEDVAERLRVIDTERAKLKKAGNVEGAEELRQLGEALKANQDLTKVKEAQEEAAKDLQRIFDRTMDNIQDAFADMFENILTGGVDSFEDFGKAILRIMARVAAEIAAMLIFRPIVQNVLSSIGIGGQGAGGIPGIGNILGGAGANTAPIVNLTLASGGTVGQGIALTSALSSIGAGLAGFSVARAFGLGEGPGGMIGGAIGATIGAFTPLGPLGAAIGGFIGAAIGGLFGNNDPAMPTVGGTALTRDGIAVVGRVQAQNMGDRALGTELVNELVNQVNALAAISGATLEGFQGVIGFREGQGFFTEVDGRNVFFETAEEALQVALARAIEQGVFKGGDEQILQEALLFGIKGAVDAFERVFDEAAEVASASISIAEDLLSAEISIRRDSIRELENFIEGLRDSAEALRRTIDEFLAGPSTTLSPQARLAEARVQLRDLASAAAGGDLEASRELPGAFGNLVDAARAMFASSLPGQFLIDEGLALLQETADAQDALADINQTQLDLELAQLTQLEVIRDTLREGFLLNAELLSQQVAATMNLPQELADNLEQVMADVLRVQGLQSQADALEAAIELGRQPIIPEDILNQLLNNPSHLPFNPTSFLPFTQTSPSAGIVNRQHGGGFGIGGPDNVPVSFFGQKGEVGVVIPKRAATSGPLETRDDEVAETILALQAQVARLTDEARRGRKEANENARIFALLLEKLPTSIRSSLVR